MILLLPSHNHVSLASLSASRGSVNAHWVEFPCGQDQEGEGVGIEVLLETRVLSVRVMIRSCVHIYTFRILISARGTLVISPVILK